MHIPSPSLPPTGAAEVCGIRLPRGRQVTTRLGATPQTVAWVSDDILADALLAGLIAKLVEAFPVTGLWPLRAQGQRGDISSPWHDGELAGPSARPSRHDALDVLRSMGAQLDHPALPVPTTLVPGTAGRELEPADLSTGPGDSGLLLVPVARPADVPARLGWLGSCNWDLDGEGASAVLRSWEERFGIVLSAIGFDTMLLMVPPGRLEHVNARALAAEVYTFCPDLFEQGNFTLEGFVHRIPRAWAWKLWWD